MLVVAAAADRLLTMDVERSAIRIAVRMISLSDDARRWFFAAPVGVAAVASPAKRAVAYALGRLEGWSPLELHVKSDKLQRSKSS